MWPFKPKKEERGTLEEILLQSGVLTSTISPYQAMNLPALVACVELIATTVASLRVNLYSESAEMTEIKKDARINLLNDDTNDSLDGFQFKRALVEDYLLLGGGYAFINKVRNDVKSLHFVDNLNVAVNKDTNPIFKKAEIYINGEMFRDFQFIKLLRKSKDGVTGKGVLKESNTLLSVAYNQMVYEEILVKTGGNKKGFLKSSGRLSSEAMATLKQGWKDLYANNNENVLVLNNGLEFQEASQTSVEMQLNEHKRTNSDEICKLFLVTPLILTGEANEEEYNNWIKICILPILSAFETALNKDLLLPSEKESHFFAFDTTELTKGDIEKRYKAYELGVKNGFMQIDEVRYRENLPPLKLNWIKMGLQDVIYFPKTEEIYTPNTNKLAKMGDSPEVEPNSQVNPNGGAEDGRLDKGLSNNPRPSEEPSKSTNPNEGN